MSAIYRSNEAGALRIDGDLRVVWVDKMHSRLRAYLLATAAAALISPALGQEAEPQKADAEETVTVTGSRLPANVRTLPGSVTILDQKKIEEQLDISSDVGQILGAAVPGMGVTTGNASSFSQTMRGRKPAILIDGVPQSAPLRDVGRDLRIVSPFALERIEVIRGATALYGLGGAGGVINFITRRPAKEGISASSEVGIGASMQGNTDESLTYLATQSLGLKYGAFDALLIASYEKAGLQIDADGEIIPPDPNFGQGGIADMETISLFGKFGYDISPNARIEATISHYDTAQDTDYVTNLIPFYYALPVTHSAVAPKATDPILGPVFRNGYAVDPSTRNDFQVVSFTHNDVFGSKLSIQVSHQDFKAVFGYSPYALLPIAPRASMPYGGGQTVLTSKKWGGRIDIATPVSFGAAEGQILWGLDFLNDKTTQTIRTGGTWVPELEQTTVAPFVQFELDVTEWLNLRGGIRYENASIDVPTFTTLQFYSGPSTIGGNTVIGGELSFDEVLFNIGAVATLIDRIEAFAGFSQGFITTDLGRLLREYTGASVAGFRPQAQIIDSYEAGLRYDSESVSATVSVFYNESEFGTTLNPITLEVARGPERIWGVEATIDARLTGNLSVGATYSWAKGEYDPDLDGVFTPLPAVRVNPVKLTGYVSADVAEGWTVRLQGLYSFEAKRNYGAMAGQFGFMPVDAFFVMDLSVSAEFGPGRFSLGIQNLLNEDYFSPDAQSFPVSYRPTRSKAAGRSVLLKYSIDY